MYRGRDSAVMGAKIMLEGIREATSSSSDTLVRPRGMNNLIWNITTSPRPTSSVLVAVVAVAVAVAVVSSAAVLGAVLLRTV